MHSSRELRSSSFAIELAGRRAALEGLLPGFGEHDRLGVVMSKPCGAVGASALISATITAFYDLQRARGPDFFIYPDYYLFHVGRPLGDHARLDVWPRRKEVVVEEDPRRILEALDDRAITRLVVEDGEPGERSLEPEVVASARGRIVTCLAYSPSGRVSDADVRIWSNAVTEGYVEAILDPETRLAKLRAEAAGNLENASAGSADATGRSPAAEGGAASASAGSADATGTSRAAEGGAAGASAGATDATATSPAARGAAVANAVGPTARVRASDAVREEALAARIAAIEARVGEVEPEVRRRILLQRRGLLEDGVPVETYRRIGLDEALALLG